VRMLALLLISLLLISSDRSTAEKPRQGELQQCFSSSDEATTESFGRECLPDGLPHVDGPAKDAHHVSAPTGATAETRGSEQRVHSLRKQLADLHQEIHSASQVSCQPRLCVPALYHNISITSASSWSITSASPALLSLCTPCPLLCAPGSRWGPCISAHGRGNPA
jgi:hypothetical protein